MPDSKPRSDAATEPRSATPPEPPRRRRKLSAIMMADVSGFSRMMGQNEDETIDLIQDFHQRVNQLVEQFEGRVVDTAGDSVFGEFDSVVNAVRCACCIQEEQAALNAERRREERVDTRIGVHLGDVIVEDYHVYGDGVNIAARLEPIADPGGICISEAVYQQIRNKLDLPLQDLGLKELKNIEHPIRIYKVPPARPSAGQQTAAAATPGTTPVSSGASAAAPTITTEVPTQLADLVRGAPLVLLALGVFLLVSPALLFPTGGVFPTAGAILVSIALGRTWAARTARPRNLLVALGVGLASGALWTNWSRATNALFFLAGLIVAASGTRITGRTERRRLRDERRRLGRESEKLKAES